MKNNIKVFAVVVLLVVGFIFAVNSPLTNSDNPETVKIGLSMPLSGGLAFAGEGAKVAAEIALESFGATKKNYEFVFEDDQFNSEKAATAANKLVNIDKVMAVISFGSITGNVISPITEKNGVVHFGIASDLNVAKGEYNFNHWTPPFEENRVLISELVERGIKKVALFETNQAGIIAVVNDFKEKVKDTNIEIVSSQRFNIGEKDFRSYISKAKGSGAELFILEAASPEIEILARQIRAAGINTPITSIESFEFSDQPELFEGQWYIGPAVESEEFARLFMEKTDKRPTLASANVYDIVRIIITASEKGEIKTVEELVSEISKIKDFDGALGKQSIDKDGVVISPAVVKVMRSGAPVTLD